MLLNELIGSGGMGTVYRGLHASLGCVAVKCVERSDTRGLDCLLNEFETTRGLQHPALVQHHELVWHPEECWLIMQYIPGATLRRWLRGDASSPADTADAASVIRAASCEQLVSPRIPWTSDRRTRVCRLFLQIARGLQHLHANGRLHRDLKPENVVVEPRTERAVIVDLGIAVRSGHVACPKELAVGTRSCLAPELLRGGQPSPSSDWYAFGLMLYEAVTGVMDQDYALRVLGGSPISAGTRNPALDHDIATLCTDLLQPRPDQRASAERVCAVLSTDQRWSCATPGSARR